MSYLPKNFSVVKREPFDEKDHYYTPPDQGDAKKTLVPIPTSVNLRSSDSNGKFFAEIYDQYSMGSCTANATAAALYYEEKRAGRSKDWEFHGSSDPKYAGPSRRFIYWLGRGGYKTDSHDISDPQDTGSFTRDAIKGLFVVGCCLEVFNSYPNYVDMSKTIKDSPLYQPSQKTPDFINEEVKKIINFSFVNMKPSDMAFEDAKKHKITAFYRVDPDRPEVDDGRKTDQEKDLIGNRTLTNLRHCLNEGFPVILSFLLYDSQNSMFKKENEKDLVLIDPWKTKGQKRHSSPTGGHGGHSVLAIGYNDTRRLVLIQNSWGPKYEYPNGNGPGSNLVTDGTFWMPYAFIQDFAATFDFWTIRTDQLKRTLSVTTWQQVDDEIKNGIRTRDPNLAL